MADLLKSFAGGWNFVLAWMFPAGIVIGAWSLLVLPGVQQAGLVLPPTMDATTKGLVLAFVVVAVGFTLAALSTPLYRVLEGYALWPGWLARRRIRAHTCRKQDLEKQAAEQEKEQSLRAALTYEKLHRYPVADSQVAPTALGNALRAMETYGDDRYQLNSQMYWSELTSVAPQGAVGASDAGRAQTDFFVALFYLTIAFALASEAAVLTEWTRLGRVDLAVMIGGLSVLVLPLAWYRAAVTSVSYWRSGVQAMVNLGRAELAKGLGLELPGTLAEEREMWARLAALTFYPAERTDVGVLDEYRDKPAAAAAAPPAAAGSHASGRAAVLLGAVAGAVGGLAAGAGAAALLLSGRRRRGRR